MEVNQIYCIKENVLNFIFTMRTGFDTPNNLDVIQGFVKKRYNRKLNFEETLILYYDLMADKEIAVSVREVVSQFSNKIPLNLCDWIDNDVLTNSTDWLNDYYKKEKSGNEDDIMIYVDEVIFVTKNELELIFDKESPMSIWSHFDGKSISNL